MAHLLGKVPVCCSRWLREKLLLTSFLPVCKFLMVAVEKMTLVELSFSKMLKL